MYTYRYMEKSNIYLFYMKIWNDWNELQKRVKMIFKSSKYNSLRNWFTNRCFHLKTQVVFISVRARFESWSENVFYYFNPCVLSNIYFNTRSSGQNIKCCLKKWSHCTYVEIILSVYGLRDGQNGFYCIRSKWVISWQFVRFIFRVLA